MPKSTHQFARVAATLWLMSACAAPADILLGEFGSAGSASGVTAGNGAAADTGAVVEGVDTQSDASRPSLPASINDAGTSADAGVPSPVAAATPVLDAAIPSTVTVARPSAGCASEPVVTDRDIQVNGMSASYLFDLPLGYDKTRAYPLVMVFRDSDVTAEEMSAELDLASVAGADAILVHANPLDGASAWEFTRDMPLVDALLAKLKSSACIDEDRVFAVGNGAGSLFVNLIGCVRADDVRAIAPLSGAPPPPGPCFGNTAVWLMQDANAEPNQLGASLGNRDYWADRNSCDVTMPRAVPPSPCVEYAGCQAGLSVRYCEYAGDELPSFTASGAWNFFQSL